MTQAELAERADLAVESVSRLETGRLANLTLRVAQGLASALGVSVGHLVGDGRARNPTLRPAEARLLALLATLNDDDVVRVHDGVRSFLGLIVRPGTKRERRRPRALAVFAASRPRAGSTFPRF